jgi:FkbM family methyltransferase
MKATIALLFIPPTRLVARYLRISRRTLWSKLIGPYLSWRDYKFTVHTEVGVSMEGSTHDTIQRYIYYFGVWEPNVHAFLQARLRPGDTFVDVGANIGYFTLLGAKLVGPQGRVVAIEASASALGQLRANIARNRVEGIVRCVHAAASDSEGTATLYQGDYDNVGTASIIRASGRPSERVRSAPLDALLLSTEIFAARVIKIDVEGAEWLVLKGMESLLPRLQPNAEIVMEITPELGTADCIVGLLANHGWNAYALMPYDSLENYLSPARLAHALRISGRIAKRTDVMFSRIAADHIRYEP